jgi:Cytochrome c, mono- and diheme variants
MRAGRRFLPLYLGIAVAMLAIIAVQKAMVRPQPEAIDLHPQGAAVLPARLDENSRMGALLYARACTDCHGSELSGSDHGPPLLGEPYRQMSDEAIVAAIENGVPASRHAFGAMPATPGLSPQDTRSIVAYVRAVQRSNPGWEGAGK